MVRSPSVDKNGLKRGAWSEEEDTKLRAYIQRYGHWNWRQLPRFAGLARCGKSCRLRWMNYLRPGLKKGSFSQEEEEMIVKLREDLGTKWSTIAAKLPGRTDNELKNYWHAHLKKRIKQDPKSTEKSSRRSKNMHVMNQKEQDSSMSLSESTDQKMESEATDASTEDISPSSHNYSTHLGGVENSFSIEESFHKFFGSFWTEPFFPTTSYNQVSSSTSFNSTVVGMEDWVTENDISLEESYLESLDNFSTEPVFSPSTICISTAKNSEESFADAFCSFWTEPAVFSNASDGLILPSPGCSFKVTTNSDEASADAFGQFSG